jgi:hypothetical protein
MQLKEITQTKCLDCGCTEIVQESKKDLHTNGHFNERRVFKCGCTLAFSPNYMRTEISVGCPNSKKIVEKKKLRDESKAKLNKFISKLNVDDDFKIKVQGSYRWT